MDATCTTARRKTTFNEGLVFSRNPLANKEMFQVMVMCRSVLWFASRSDALEFFATCCRSVLTPSTQVGPDRWQLACLLLIPWTN